MFLIFDTETTGFPKDWNAPLTDFDNWPRVVQIAWQIHGPEGELIDVQDHIIYPDGYDIPFNATKIHGISTDRAKAEGKPLADVLATFQAAMETCEFVIGHNVRFDLNVTGCEYLRTTGENPFTTKKSLDSCTEITAELCQIRYQDRRECHRRKEAVQFYRRRSGEADVFDTEPFSGTECWKWSRTG